MDPKPRVPPTRASPATGLDFASEGPLACENEVCQLEESHSPSFGRAYEEDNFAPMIMRPHNRYSAAESPLCRYRSAAATEIVTAPAIVPAQLGDLLRYSVHRMVCRLATHSRVASFQVALHMGALGHCCSLWHCCWLGRTSGDLHKSAKYHMAKSVRSKQHAVTVQTSGISCTAETRAAAAATSLASASAGTYGGTRA
jgi:hypothetical protein